MGIVQLTRRLNGAALVESARVGADALRTNPMRTVLSTTGVIIGVAALPNRNGGANAPPVVRRIQVARRIQPVALATRIR